MEHAIRSVTIHYQTADIIPAPYSHHISFTATVNSKQELQTSFRIEYLDREELTEEEIESEGFTGDDDFAWEGTLAPAWTAQITRLLGRTDYHKAGRQPAESENWITVEGEADSAFSGSPRNHEEWEYLSQELMQAVYETARLEAPLRITYLKLEKDGSDRLDISVLFATRSIETLLSRPTGKKNGTLNWDTLNPVLKLIYTGDFLPEKAIQREPRQPGRYLEIGDGLWYELGVSLVNPPGNHRFLSHIEKTLDGLLNN